MLSIIIPIYNSEKYLRDCLASVIDQTYKDLEIILVDNNSTDNSLKICKEYAAKDNRIRLMQERKKGAAAARNLGIKAAKGDYITFADSDDYLREDAYEILLNRIKKSNCDIMCYAFHIVDELGNKKGWYEPRLRRYEKGKCCYTGEEAAKIYLTSRDIEGFGWNKIFTRKFVEENAVLYDESKIAYEDMAVFFEAILKAERVSFCAEKLYYYRQVGSSLTHKQYENKNKDYISANNTIIALARQNGLNREANIFIARQYVYGAYNKMKNGEKVKACNELGKLQILWNIFVGLKSEKIKMLLKALLIGFNL